jgi:Yip1 domain/zinc-ribbon domain
MFCPQCGKPVLDGAKFCNYCGASLAAAPVAEPAPVAATYASGSSSTRGQGAFGTSGSSPASGSSTGGPVGRIRNILLSPKTEWTVIAAEPSSPSSLYLGYVAPLVAIGVVATFIGHSMVGLPLVGRVGVGAALAHAVISYVLSFVGVFLIAVIVDLLAPAFGGQRDSLAALKVTVYSFTPGWIAGIFNLIPMLGVLGIIAALYGLYLLYLGLPVLMRCPADKSVGYTVVTVICAVVTWVVIAVLTTCAVGGLGVVGLGAMGRMGAHTDPGAGAGDAAAVATRPGDGKPVDVNAALGAVGKIMSGGKDVQPIDFHRLKDMLPEALPGMQRLEVSGQGGEAMGLKGSSASARYSDGKDASITIEIADMASLSGLRALASRFDPNIEKETDTGYERTRRVDGQLVHERYDRASRSGELGIVLADRYAVTVRGHGVPAEALAGALKRVDLTRLASAGR